jgi:L-alanine-DL-glutamate epimerase-like enolase superfamily enzyme
MRIEKVHAFLLSYPFPEPIELPFHGGRRTILKRDAMLVRIDTDKGLTGYAPGPGSEQAQHAIERTIAPFLEGRMLADPDALRVQFLDFLGSSPALAKLYGAIEIALFDLIGKARGVPVSELIGGRVRDRIRLYGSAGMYMPPEAYAAEARAIADLGFRAYKMRPALGPEKDVETVALMRQAVGPDFDLMVDAHTWWRMGDRSYDPATVESLAEAMAEYDIAWLEEPMPPDDHEAYLRLKEKDLVPLASGEHEPDELRYMDLAAQLGICWPEMVVEWLEYPCYSTPTRAGMYPFPLAAEILKDPLNLDHGDLIVPRGPGLGVEIDERVIDRYPWIPGPWSLFHIDSPAETRAVTADHSIKWEGLSA